MNEQILQQILQELQALKQGQANLEKRLVNLEEGQSSLQAQITKLSENQARMEISLTERIDGLYDFRETQKDINKEIITRLDRIETKVDKLELETSHVRLIK